ncbi:TetR/AcrR family transcriptional regulator [Ammoniphilus resinae]|uniref:AcrR family transcriptional regulator n=1 Tax=Ammoniphilus resinae TaxID=861532 RepID=A0ABS4GRM1_9BACL|nr:TetR/AcrR family transcriptional regulator [Ammoniphilus resinae]MBP1932772.1 AcrR family transcriptional regulator [Ammoniphilus resinae]
MSPRTSKQNEEIRVERVKQILSAAIEVYVEKGVRGTEMGDIARKAGIARGLVYYYFKDKMELFRELFSQSISTAQQFIRSRLQADEDSLIKLKKYTRFYLEMAQKQPLLLKFYRNMENDFELVFAEDSHSVAESYYHHAKQPLVDVFIQAMNEGKLKRCEPKVIVNVYWGGLTGMLDLLASGYFEREESEKVIEQVVELLFAGLQKHSVE